MNCLNIPYIFTANHNKTLRMSNIIIYFCLIALTIVNATSYWDVSTTGFLPVTKERSCIFNNLHYLCKTMRTNPTTENIVEAVKKISITDIIIATEFNEVTEGEIEDMFHWFSVAACRVGYNQNPSGSKTGVPIVIPFDLNIRLLLLANHLKREPTTGYASLVLDNCVRFGAVENRPDSYDNYDIQRTVTSATDPAEEFAHRAEKGFYASHCAVEHAFGPAVENLHELRSVTNANDADTQMLTRVLRNLAYNTRQTIPVLKHMRHFFNSEHFFRYLRPFIKCGNIGDNGVIFEGISGVSGISFDLTLPNGTIRNIPFDETIYGFRGPTGAQTSSLSAIDAGLQIMTSISADPNLEITMKEFRQYHPTAHCEFNDEITKLNLRDHIVVMHNNELTDAYNDAVTAVAEFRFAHVDHVMTYIFKSIPHVPKKEVGGTGNTPIASYLCKSAVGTLLSRIKQGASANLPTVSVPSICSQECFVDHTDVHDQEYCTKFNELIE